MNPTTKATRWLYLSLAGATWLLATGLILEKFLADGTSSYALLLATPVFTGAVGLLLHIAFTSLWKWLYALPLAALCLCVTLPASIGASGGARDAAVLKAEAANRTADEVSGDLKNIKATLKWAREDMASECATGEGTACRGKRSTVKALEDRQDKLTAGLKDVPAKIATLSGETRVAWALGKVGVSATNEDVQTIWPILPPIALELLCACFLTMGLSIKGCSTVKHSQGDSAQTSFPTNEPLPSPGIFSQGPEPGGKARRLKPRKAKIEHAIATVREHTLKHGEPPKFSVVRAKHRLAKSSASRALAEGIRQAKAA